MEDKRTLTVKPAESAGHGTRIYIFDLLRGLAVFLMILAHSVYFFHSRDNSFLVSLEGFGNTVCYVTFLLVSGAVAYIAYLNRDQSDWQKIKKRIVSRTLILLASYYILALILTADQITHADGFLKWRIIFNIFSFRYLPGFTEYFPPFIFYSLLLAYLPNIFRFSTSKITNLFGISAFAYLAGVLLYYLPLGKFLLPWQAFFVGGGDVYRFPILHYLPVFLLGLYWGRLTLENDNKTRKLIIKRLSWVFGLVALVSILLLPKIGLSYGVIFLRWPPTLPFLSLGLTFAFLLAYIILILQGLKRSPLVRDFFLLCGQNALALFWSHVFLLGLYQMAGGARVSSPFTFIFAFGLVIIISLALATFIPFNFRFSLTFIHEPLDWKAELEREPIVQLGEEVVVETMREFRGIKRFFFPSPRDASKRTIKKRHVFGLSIIALLLVLAISPATVQEIATIRQSKNSSNWWSDEYSHRQMVTIRNDDAFIDIQPGETLKIIVNHKQLVESKKSLSSGADLKVVYWDGKTHRYLNHFLENPATDGATLWFTSPVEIRGGKSNQFFSLYYGNNLAKLDGDSNITKASKASAVLQTEESFPILLSISRDWNLRGLSTDPILTLASENSIANPTVGYEIIDANISGRMNISGRGQWQANIPLDELKPGVYQIQATIKDEESGKISYSQKCGFHISYPLYVAWTLDWEGYDANQSYISAIEAISTQHNLPLTHFFNPRIYTTETISADRANYLTNWLKQRLDKGDDVGLHLHMFYDYVRNAGLEPKVEPNWGDKGDGYGVPIATYSKDEQVKIISHGVSLLSEHGFPLVNKFRAGGWFASLDTLVALDELGLEIDSSGRTQYKFGSNNLQGYWDLLPTTKPYKPSLSNQNRSSLSNTFNLLEIPNNGADSYAFSASDMINRFKDNYSGNILSEKQQITYLSHPHWFNDKEQERVKTLFSHIEKYSALSDSGPVIFTTTQGIYDSWMKDD